MAKQKKEKKPKKDKGGVGTLTEVFFVAEKTGAQEWVSGYHPQQGVQFSTDLMDAVWAYDGSKVQTFITRNNIQNVTVQQKEGGNHPNKPPLP